MRYVAYFDGLCEPVNPGGVATYGYVVFIQGFRVVGKGKGVAAVGMWGERATNNVAEYAGVIAALRELQKLGAVKPIVRGDSRLVIKQLRGEWRLRSEGLRELYAEALSLVKRLNAVLEWVPREDNTFADRLSREAYEEFIEENKEQFMKYYSKYLK
jgi:ribonuclease HI